MTCYASVNFQSKKAFKEAVKRGDKITIRILTPTGELILDQGSDCVCGPWYPAPHKWYAKVKVDDGKIVSVK